jgi:hypothetical protein
LHCLSYVQRYLQPCCTGQLLNLYIEVMLTHIVVHLRILVQGDGVVCLIDMCWVNDLDRALIPQVLTVHGLHPTYKYHTKKMYCDSIKMQHIEQVERACMNLQAPDD